MSESHFTFSEFVAGFWRMESWDMTPMQRLNLIEQYLELGVTTMDHADIYGQYQCETLFGEALALKPALRQQMQIVSKCGIKPAFACRPERYVNHYDTSCEHIIASVEHSLKQLNTDYLDLLLIHRPDPLMDADAVAEAFKSLKQAGKVQHFGVSNFTNAQFSLLQSRLDAPLVTNQVELSPLAMSTLHDGTLDLCQQRRIRPMAWSCLAGGKIFETTNPQAVRLHQTLKLIAEQVGAQDISQVIYAWVRMLPSRPVPLIGSGNIERIKRAVASNEIQLDRQQWFSIWQASMGHSVP
ncbi:MAG: aldo/keto reductase family oxidoreductase [Gammaproteobacteria bacterium]|uniref:aldo/keto reductase n=1 Tax=Shewanella sp. Pdp11 TaxID=2059264 RepID=UPI000CA1600E|nr:aldo/keto reductase family oxidoreductase [Shewanella sp. Pdp11]MBU1394427.1 aldo/keto reductase family oxidoreductase [Gammaproteobacteria bacterium]QYX64244.1 aldo/keto reductase family oxidoreductase [Shewanella putrefaciens]AUD57980.1 oxidoreductase [Shewanella sp. Pdp11]MBU1478787.1 aldo/keto reductase family oxidoreductase [Gammaproteobacteria bacterium]MBU2003309.1 aldo/keto reductase family oxidoreductase [Gammaproteobacteria bacterium]